MTQYLSVTVCANRTILHLVCTSINQLQNAIIQFILKICLKNLKSKLYIGDTVCEFYNDDITVTSFINVKYHDVAAESIL